VPDLQRFGDDRNVDRAALRDVLLALGAGRVAAGGGMGIVLNASKATARDRTPRAPTDAEIADHLLQRTRHYHLLGAPTPALPFPDGITLRCPRCGGEPTAAPGGLECACGERYARRRGVLAFARDLPLFAERVDAMLAERGGPAYREQRRDLLDLAARLELPFEVRTSWSFGDPVACRGWHWSAGVVPIGGGRFRVDGVDPYLQLDMVGCEPEAAQIVAVEMAVRLDDATARHEVAGVCWLVDGQLGFSAQCAASVVVIPDGQLRTYRFEAPSSVRGEVLIALRVDPISFGSGEVHLRSIRLDRRIDDA
jgi:hypothetical protein